MKRTMNAGCSKVYPLFGGALVPLFRVKLCLDGCADLLCPSIQPIAVHFLFVPAFVRTQGAFCGMDGVS